MRQIDVRGREGVPGGYHPLFSSGRSRGGGAPSGPGFIWAVGWVGLFFFCVLFGAWGIWSAVVGCARWHMWGQVQVALGSVPLSCFAPAKGPALSPFVATQQAVRGFGGCPLCARL